MNAQRVYADIQALNNLVIKIGKKEPAAIAELSRVHAEVYGETVCVTCHQKHIKAFHKLQSLTLENLIAMSDKAYKLKPGQLIEVGGFGSGKHYTNHNLTDKVAQAFIEENPEGIKYFSEYPEQEKKESKKKADKAE